MSYLLNAVSRALKGEKVRAEGVLPAVIYGAGGKTESLSMVYTDFEKLFREAGEASLIDLKIDDKDAGKVLVHEVQYDPVKGQMIHVDLIRVNMSKPITAFAELKFVGEAPAVKELGGTLVHNINEVEIKCLPKDLVSHIDVDVSSLKTFDDVVKYIVPADSVLRNISKAIKLPDVPFASAADAVEVKVKSVPFDPTVPSNIFK